MVKRYEQYVDYMARLYPSKHKREAEDSSKYLSKTITFQVTDRCNLACTYCYQINKGTRRMSLETAKKFFDMVVSGEKGFKNYINPEYSKGLVIEFIGGEPLLEIDLIDEIMTYIRNKLIELEHPWADTFVISICSNGVLYFQKNVQKFLQKYKGRLNINITIDGNKDLHDSCRIFPDGKPSYDLAVAAAKDWMDRGYYMGSKITIAKENINYLYDAFKHMLSLGYDDIIGNCVYEAKWDVEDAKILYQQLKKCADYLLEHYSPDDIYFSFFEEKYFEPKEEDDNNNWCGGNGGMLACDPDGVLFPCIRYMESSLGVQQKPYVIGTLETGIGQCEDHQQCIDCMKKITRRSQSTDECFHCPISEGCSWCSAYNYQVYGTVNKRDTKICIMHKARALANYYFWNKYYHLIHSDKRKEVFIPDEWALEIISKNEFDMIKELSK